MTQHLSLPCLLPLLAALGCAGARAAQPANSKPATVADAKPRPAAAARAKAPPQHKAQAVAPRDNGSVSEPGPTAGPLEASPSPSRCAQIAAQSRAPNPGGCPPCPCACNGKGEVVCAPCVRCDMRRHAQEALLAPSPPRPNCGQKAHWGCGVVTQGAAPDPHHPPPKVCGCVPTCQANEWLLVSGAPGKWPNGTARGSFSCTPDTVAPPP